MHPFYPYLTFHLVCKIKHFETACVLWYCIHLQMNAGIWLDRDNTIQEVMEKYSHMDTSGNELR